MIITYIYYCFYIVCINQMETKKRCKILYFKKWWEKLITLIFTSIRRFLIELKWCRHASMDTLAIYQYPIQKRNNFSLSEKYNNISNFRDEIILFSSTKFLLIKLYIASKQYYSTSPCDMPSVCLVFSGVAIFPKIIIFCKS